MALKSDALAAEVWQDHRRGLARQGTDAEVAHERGDVGGVRGPGGAPEPEARERERRAERGAPGARPPASTAFLHERLHPGHERAQRAPRSGTRR